MLILLEFAKRPCGWWIPSPAGDTPVAPPGVPPSRSRSPQPQQPLAAGRCPLKEAGWPCRAPSWPPEGPLLLLSPFSSPAHRRASFRPSPSSPQSPPRPLRLLITDHTGGPTGQSLPPALLLSSSAPIPSSPVEATAAGAAPARRREEEMEYRRVKDQESYDDVSQKDIESPDGRSLCSTAATSSLSTAGGSKGKNSWKLKSIVTLALTLLTSSQAILIVWSKRAGKYEYSVTTANFSVEALKCLLSLIALYRTWNSQGVTEDNRLSTSFDEVSVYPIPAILYMVKNLLQYYIFAYVDAPAYQILKNLNIISTGVLYRIILKKKLSEIQWAAFILLCAGCTTAQLNPSSDHVLQTPIQGWMMAIVMALLSGFAGVYTEAIIKKRPSRNINVQNFWLYIFGMLFNLVAICVQDFDAVMNKGFFHGYSFITVLMILNHALSGIAVSMVMKYADNIVKVYSTSVAMLLTAIVSVFLFGFHLSLAFFLGSTVVSVSVYLHSAGKPQQQK